MFIGRSNEQLFEGNGTIRGFAGAGQASAPRHFAFLDGVRGWAAFAVFFYHLRIDRPETALIRARVPQWSLDLAVEGKHGVAVFFVLSGLVIAYSLRAHLGLPAINPGGGDDHRHNPAPFDARNFALRRVVRLTPPYHAAIIVTLVFAFGAAIEGGHDYLPGGTPFSVARLVTHLVYAQELLGFANFNDVFWTLSIELQFYFAFAALVWAYGRLSRRARTDATGMTDATDMTDQTDGAPALVTLQSLYAASAMLSLLWPLGLLGGDGRAVWFLPLWYSFMLGVLVFARWRRQIPAWTLAAYMAILTAAPLISGRGGAFVWVSVGTTAVLWLALERDRLSTWLADRVSQFLGRVSYSLYLTHTPVLGATSVVMAKLLGTPSLTTEIVGVIVTAAATMVAAELFYRTVERPAIMLSRRLKDPSPLTRRRSGRPVSPTG